MGQDGNGLGERPVIIKLMFLPAPSFFIAMARRYRARHGVSFKVVGNYIPAPIRINVCGHPERKHLSKGMCRSCHSKWRLRVKPEYRISSILRAKRWVEKNPQRYHINQGRLRPKAKGEHLYRKFGITEEQYLSLLGNQGGVCRICKRPPKNIRLAVDHCHKTKRVRGLLCGSCNQGLGMFRDDPSLLEEGIKYLNVTV